MSSLLSRAVIYGLMIVLGLLSALPNLLSPAIKAELPNWYTENTLSLGLDLQGGSHLLLEVDTDDLFRNELQDIREGLIRQFREHSVYYTRPQTSEHELRIPLRDQAHVAKAAGIARELAPAAPDGLRRFHVKTEGRVLILTLNPAWKEKLALDAVQRSLEVVRRRLDETGLVEPSITRQGEDGILVQMPGVADPTESRS
ncbi:MAG: protein translocase subunit SecDF, partial [Gammaproteobacteria bacterium]|nr:protein translocase subunit SecDF [Gammaproteobacteria bacterium]